MRFTTVAAAAGLAVSANAAVPRRGLKDLFNGEFKLPLGINLAKEDLVGPWNAPGEGESETYHPPHHHVVIDGCDRSDNDDWHYVHNPHPEESHKEEYKWVTETITATETVIDCDACEGGGKTTTVVIPETVTICPTPIEPPVEETPYPEPPVEESPYPEPPAETHYPEPPVEESPYPEPPAETPYPEPPVEESPYPEPPAESEPIIEPPVETPYPEPPVEETPYPEPPASELPVPPPAPPVESESLPIYPPEETYSVPMPTPTDGGAEVPSEVPTAAAVPNAQRAGGALVAAAIAVALF